MLYDNRPDFVPRFQSRTKLSTEEIEKQIALFLKRLEDLLRRNG